MNREDSPKREPPPDASATLNHSGGSQPAGEERRAVSVAHDVTPHRQVEQALHDFEIMYRTLFDGSKAGIIVADEQTKRFRYANSAACAMLGYTPDELIRLGVTDIHPLETMEVTMAAFDEMVNGTRNFVETQCLRKDGSVLDVSINSSLATVDGRVCAFGFFTDITDRRRNEQALRESEGKYRKLHESMRDAFVIVDMAGRILEYNPAYQEMLGYPKEELRRLTYVDITPEKWHAFEARLVAEQILPLGFSELYQKEYRRKDGSIFPVELSAFLIRDDDGNPFSIWAIVRDITDRVRNEQALRKSEMRYREIIELAVDGILLGTPEGKISGANSQMQKLAGKRLDQLLGRHVSELFDPEDLVAHPLRFDLLNLVRPYVTERALLRPDGSKLPVEMHSKRMPDGTYQSIYRDISERQKAEQTMREWNQTLERRVAERTMDLQQSEARFRQLAETTFEGIAISENGILTDGNAQVGVIHGYELAEMIGQPVTNFIAPESREMAVEHLHEGYEITYECVGLRKDGSRFPTEIHGRMGTWHGKTSRITAVRDLTEIKLTAEQLQVMQTELEQAQRLALISEVSAGIIHQIGQPVCAMGANVAAATAKVSGCKAKHCGALGILKDIETDVDTMRKVITHMRTLAHDAKPSRTPTDLNRLLEDVLRLLRQEAANRQVRFVVRQERDLPPVVVDMVQINQVILNLARNAFDSCANCPPERRTVSITTQTAAGPGVELSVTDTGTGIAPEVMEHLFEPFFTTKSAGLGIGLRLSRTITEAHGGSIHAHNNPNGIGATFRVILPGQAAAPDAGT